MERKFSTRQEMSLNRGVVLDKYLSIERAIDMLICMRYLKTISFEFIEDLMFFCRGHYKIQAFECAYPDEYKIIKSELKSANTLRNIFAHGHHMRWSENGEPIKEILDRRYLFPRNLKGEPKVKDLYDDFMTNAEKANDYLWKIVEEEKKRIFTKN